METERHSIEVRARTAGDYLSLDPEPVKLSIQTLFEDDGVRYDPPLPRKMHIRPDLHPAVQMLISKDENEPARVGCATAAGRDIWAPALLLLVACRRRRIRT